MLYSNFWGLVFEMFCITITCCWIVYFYFIVFWKAGIIANAISSLKWRKRFPSIWNRDIIYGIRRCLIGVGSITEVKQRRARFIIGWVTAWDCQVPYTLQDIVQRCRVVGLREPRKSDGSSDWLWVGRKITSMDVGAVSIRRDPRKSTMWSTWHAHKAMNYIMNNNRPC